MRKWVIICLYLSKSKARLGTRKFGSRVHDVDQYVVLFQTRKTFKTVLTTWQAYAKVQDIKTDLSQDLTMGTDALQKMRN